MPLKRKAAAAPAAAAPEVKQQTQDDFTSFAADSDADSDQDDTTPAISGLDDSDDDSDGAAAEDDRIIALRDLRPTITTALASRKSTSTTTKPQPGVLYIGRIPHGFYEQEMEGYFGQFGTVSRLRLSRSKRTGRSKHFAFVEFEDREVAEVVAKSMHNYLLAGRLLQVSLLSDRDVAEKGGSEQLFKGAGRKFKAVPWHAVEKARLEEPKTEQRWAALEKKDKARRSRQADKIKAAGIDYEYEAPSKAIEDDAETAPASLASLTGKKRKAPKGPADKAATKRAASGKRSSSSRKVSVH